MGAAPPPGLSGHGPAGPGARQGAVRHRAAAVVGGGPPRRRPGAAVPGPAPVRRDPQLECGAEFIVVHSFKLCISLYLRVLSRSSFAVNTCTPLTTHFNSAVCRTSKDKVSHLCRWHPPFGGVVLSFSNEEIVSAKVGQTWTLCLVGYCIVFVLAGWQSMPTICQAV